VLHVFLRFTEENVSIHNTFTEELMRRTIEESLSSWKKRINRKPLVVRGARQVGKTWTLKEFGKQNYTDVAYFNFEKQTDLGELFKVNLDVKRILQLLSAIHGRLIQPEKTLIIFDEIQACGAALTSLKYFSEDAPTYHIAAAGSLLGVKLGQERSFPVGKVNFIDLHPMTLKEFLLASDDSSLVETLQHHDSSARFPDVMHHQLLHQVRSYLMIGGMPEAVKTWFATNDFEQVRQVQTEILTSYQNDFQKHTSESDAIRIQRVWDSIPLQIARENKKFKYSDVKKGGRSAEFEIALHWLEAAGLVLKTCHVASGRRPLTAYLEPSHFKLFSLDVGLLAAQLRIAARAFLVSDKIFDEFNGAFTENLVAQELTARGIPLSYWSSEHEAEVDFLFEIGDTIVPLEVKAGISRKTKSLRVFEKKFKPEALYRTTALNFSHEGGIQNIPFYAWGSYIDRRLEALLK
jgi:predicted AAA+ superfamily ATPase